MEARALTPTFYQWIYGLYPDIPETINKEYAQEAPARREDRAGAGLRHRPLRRRGEEEEEHVGRLRRHDAVRRDGRADRRPARSSRGTSTSRSRCSTDLIPSIRQEATYKGHIWSFPFLLDIIIQAWNGELVKKAGLDPSKAPKTWDEFIANAKKVVSSKAAPYGAVFDAHGWRSLAPITHTFSTNVYTARRACSTSRTRPRVNALEVMKRLMEVAPKNILEEGKVDGGVNTTPDEEAFAGAAGRLLRQVPERADALRRHVARPEGAAHRRAAEGERAAAAPCSGTRARRSSSTARTSSRPPTT